MTPHPLRALPKLSRAQANALRLSACEGGLRWDGVCWKVNVGIGVRVIHVATADMLERLGCLDWTRSYTLHPSDVGRAWLAANPDPCA